MRRQHGTGTILRERRAQGRIVSVGQIYVCGNQVQRVLGYSLTEEEEERKLKELVKAHNAYPEGMRSRPQVELRSAKAITSQPTVYFAHAAQVPDSPVKIGFSVHAEERLATLSRMSPFAITPLLLLLCSSFDGGRALERSLHVMFQHLRLHGEWFLPGDDLLEYIRSNT